MTHFNTAEAQEHVAEARNHVENFRITEGDRIRVTRLANTLLAVPSTENENDDESRK